ncbi:MAG TPA: thiamine-phosphate kinase [Pyrinomonadaceae bacterium]|nr:thiamine-phosphate kinase [Pyrinomonadaceae bacterium]
MRSEFEFINNIKKRYRLDKVGDDCAVLPKDAQTDLLITSDVLVEGVDFRHEWATPEQIGHKALAISLSDVAAMGGNPTFALLSIAVDEKLWKTDFLDRFYAGWQQLATKFDVELVGGDVSRTSGPLVIDSTVLGEVSRGKAILRSGAKVGDAIYVSGTLGSAAAGLAVLQKGRSSDPKTTTFLLSQLEPIPHVGLGKLIRSKGLGSSAIDLSDGLSSDLMHICRMNRVGAAIEADRLPIDPDISNIFGAEPALEMALHGGEDFQLLFTGDQERISAAAIPGISRIGVITSKAETIDLKVEGVITKLQQHGYRHF